MVSGGAAGMAAAQALAGAERAKPVAGDPGLSSMVVTDQPAFRVLRDYAEPGATRRMHSHDDTTYHVFVLVTGELLLTVEGEAPVKVTAGRGAPPQRRRASHFHEYRKGDGDDCGGVWEEESLKVSGVSFRNSGTTQTSERGTRNLADWYLVTDSFRSLLLRLHCVLDAEAGARDDVGDRGVVVDFNHGHDANGRRHAADDSAGGRILDLLADALDRELIADLHAGLAADVQDQLRAGRRRRRGR